MYVACIVGTGKRMTGEQIEQIKCSKINHTESPVQKLFGDAVGKKSLSHAGISVEKQIVKPVLKIVRKRTAAFQGRLSRLPGSKAGSAVSDVV